MLYLLEVLKMSEVLEMMLRVVFFVLEMSEISGVLEVVL